MIKISELKVENLASGCVTDKPDPSVSFALESDRNNEAMKNAVIKIGDWVVVTDKQQNIRYGGAPLNPFTKYNVFVKAETENGEIAEASTQFETGRLSTPWAGEFITDASYAFGENVSPAPMTFKKVFAVGKAVKRAFVNSTAMGIYYLFLNGKRVGNDYFAPGFTSYKHTLQYQTYDVTELLVQNNTLYAVVGAGWAVGRFTYRSKTRISADRQALCLELRIEYADGTSETIKTDSSWQVTTEGKYKFGDFYDGEIYDARVEPEKTFRQASVTALRVRPKIVAQYGLPVVRHEVLKPVGFFRAESGEYIYDFGQNFAGVISAKIKGKSGDRIVFRHAEVLSDGELFVKSLRTAKATAEYICSGAKEEEYSPILTYMGFRYVGVRGIEAQNLELSAYVLHSDLEETGTFECSNDELNRLQRAIRWGGKSNFVDIPTDCPQRDERQGWTGDISVFAPTACYNFDMSRFLDKWLLDVNAEQGRWGGIPMVVPRHGDAWPPLATACWGDSCITVPWALYLARGDEELLRRQYPVMKKFLKAVKHWAGFLSVGKTKRRIWKFPFQFGDWCAPYGTSKEWMGKGKWVATAYWANSCAIAAKAAEILGKPKDAAHYKKLRREVCNAYRKEFTDGKGRLLEEFQTGYVLPIYFDMFSEREKDFAAGQLDKLVKAADHHLDTGFTGTPYLLFALSDNGYLDEAYRVLLQDTCPSWLYEIKAGGTTLWERWDALRPDGTVNLGNGSEGGDGWAGGMVSFNHYAYGAVGDWMYRRIAGIEPLAGGYKKFIIAPKPGGGLRYAKASLKTPYGQIVSQWNIGQGEFRLNIEVPVSAECTVLLPDGSKIKASSGKHAFSCKM